MQEVVEQHEYVHKMACVAFSASHPFSINRWSTLADYAAEEIEGYGAS
jgi:hypothetical protein